MIPVQSLHFRLLFPFSMALILAIALAWWIATSMLTSTLENRLERQLVHAGEVLANGELPLTKELLQRLSRLLRADLILIQPDGKFAISTLDDKSNIAPALATHWRSALSHTKATIVQERGAPFMLVTQQLSESRDPRYLAVAVVASLDNIQNAASSTARWLGTAALFGIIILGWAGHKAILGITQPVQKLAQMADQIATGRREIRVDIGQANELGVLANALNTMAERLQVYEREIAEQNRLAALGSMGARIAHEIRNPLTAIKLELQLLAESLPSEQRGTADALLDEVRRLELIATSALQVGQGTHLSCRPTDLNDPVSEVTRLFKTQFDHRNIQLESLLKKDQPQVQVDPDRIKQVLVNLLVNAGDALAEGGIIRVGTDRGPNEVLFWVEDSGPGIPAKHRATLFSGASSSKPGGLGIGLKLSKELVELQGGEIQVEESSLGGARFVVRFPVEKRP